MIRIFIPISAVMFVPIPRCYRWFVPVPQYYRKFCVYLRSFSAVTVGFLLFSTPCSSLVPAYLSPYYVTIIPGKFPLPEPRRQKPSDHSPHKETTPDQRPFGQFLHNFPIQQHSRRVIPDNSTRTYPTKPLKKTIACRRISTPVFTND